MMSMVLVLWGVGPILGKEYEIKDKIVLNCFNDVEF